MALTVGGRGKAPALGNNSRQGGGVRELIACVVVSIVLITASTRMGESGPLAVVRSAFSSVTMPVRYIGSAVTAPIQGLGNVFANLTADQETLSELKEQNEQLQARNVELEEAEQTATRLQSLLNVKDSYNLQSTAARIISGSTSSWSSTVTLDKGTSDGITVGMPVMGGSGVIGQIVECGANSSTVRLISDEDSSISAMVQSSRAQGMLVGSATGQVSLSLIRTGQTVNVGDVVVTSGLGGVFPKGLPLGKVTSVENTPGSLYLDIVVETFAHTENQEEVLIITSLTEEQQVTAEEIAQADAQETSDVTAATDGTTTTEPTDDSESADGTDSSDSTESTESTDEE